MPGAGVGTRGHDRSSADRRRRTAGPATFDPLAPAGRRRRPTADLARIRANVTFWGDRFTAEPARLHQRDAAGRPRRSSSPGRPVTSAPTSRPSAAVDGALKAYPDYALALDYRGVIQVALHRFADARANADGDPRRPARTTRPRSRRSATRRSSWVTWPPPARPTPGSSPLDDSAAARVRDQPPRLHRGPDGRRRQAVPRGRSPPPRPRAPSAAVWPGIEYQLGDTLIAHRRPDRRGRGLRRRRSRPTRASHLAHWGLGRVAAADGRLDDAIARGLDGDRHRAAARVPGPPRRPVPHARRRRRRPARGRRPQDGPGDRPAGRRRRRASTTGPWRSTSPDPATTRPVPWRSPRPRSRSARTSTATMRSPGRCSPTTARRRPTPR